jgi:iron complex outermembrane receptor protein
MKTVNPVFLLFLFFFCVFTHTVIAQQAIEGRVLDLQTDEPMIGVNLVVEGTSTGTTTDINGYFKFTLPAEATRIQVSYVGYIKQYITLRPNQGFLNILMRPDNVSLNEVQVIGFNSNKKLQETAASLGLITSKDFERTNRVSLQPVLNTIPGVQMDQSNLTDARISIRGTGVRSNFGIRNIKIYVNEIPITEADGFTRIEGLDVSTIGRAEVIKGPASSIYGTGTGGVLNFQLQKAAYGKNSVEANTMVGSYGLGRIATTYRTGTDSFNAAFTLGNQVYDGYREHNTDTRYFFTGSMQFFPSQKQTLTLLLNRSRQETQIPGTITADQVAQNPKQANATNLAKEAGRYQTWTRIGAAHSYKFSPWLENSTSLYTSFYDLDHPLPFAYIRQPYQSYGGRTRFSISPEMATLPTKITLGSEFQNGQTSVQRFVNNGGKISNQILNQELNNTQLSVFIQSETSLTENTHLTAGLSYNRITYKVNDLRNPGVSGTKKFDGELMPRIALVHVFNDQLALRGGISFGFSPPTTSEITAADGTIRDDIQAERGVNYEVGARGTMWDSKFNYDVTLFSFQMQDQLVPQSVGPNNTIYNNAGKTSKLGVETALSYFWSNSGSFIRTLRPFLSYTYSHFEFEEFVLLDAGGQVIRDYSGNEVTGISPHVLSAGLDVTTSAGLYLNTTYFYNGEAPITDDNSIYNDAYSLLNAKIGWKQEVTSFLNLNINGGINNLLNESYTSRISLNASSFGGGQPPFYDPAPKRNVYGMLSFTFIF